MSYPPGIQASIPQDQFGSAFWNGSNSVACSLELQYDNASGSDPMASVGVSFSRNQPITGGIRWPQSLDPGPIPLPSDADTVLSGNAALENALAKSYAPEAVILEPDDASLNNQAHDRFWVLGQQPQSGNPASLPIGDLGLDTYQWLKIPYDPALSESNQHLLFLVPYPEHLKDTAAPFTWTHRQAQSLTRVGSWATVQNLIYRYESNRFILVVFVPESALNRGGSAAIPTAAAGSEQVSASQFSAWLTQVDANHNRILNVSHQAGGRKAYSISFTDRLGRAQEVRALGSHSPSTDLNGQVLVSGTTTFDALGRPVKSAKAFYQAQSVANFPVTGTRAQTYAAANAFWSSDKTLPGESVPYVDVQPGDRTYSERLYEADPRGRVVAEVPLGQALGSDPALPDWSTLRYPRFHYFTVKAPNLTGLPTLYSLPSVKLNGTWVSGMFGTLAVDPEGSVIATFSGNDSEITLITVVNPSADLMESWGLTVVTDAGPESAAELKPDTVYLPANYATRLDQNNGDSANLVSFNVVDGYGRLQKSYPPRALQVTAGTAPTWSINQVTLEAGLATQYTYDRFQRIIQVTEPDAGTTLSKYNKVGWLRFAQDSKQRAANPNRWTEVVYDDLGRAIETRDITFSRALDEADWAYQTERVQSASRVDDPATPANEQIARTLVSNSQLAVSYDGYPTDTNPPWSGTEARWPSLATLQTSYDSVFGAGSATWGSGYGLQTETRTHTSAERLYYDDRGLILARVRLIQGLNEPHVSFWKYEGFDGKLTEYRDMFTGMQMGYAYDAWDRLVQVYDLRPITWRLKLEVAFQAKNAGGSSSQADQATTYLGPLVDPAAATVGGFTPSNTIAQQTAEYVHAPTGHVAKMIDAAGLVRRAQYDIRDLAMSGETLTSSQFSVFKQSFGYEQAASGYQTFNGNIGEMTETYGPITGSTFQNQRRFTYDLISQLLHSNVAWNTTGTNETVENSYEYDANGNRKKEWRVNVPSGANNQPNDQEWELSHAVPNGKNQLTQVDLAVDGTTRPRYYDAMQYDGIGNITSYATHKDGNSRNYTFTYGDARFPILPTAIAVIGYQPVRETFTYDHTGTRIKRELDSDYNPATPNEITYYIPYGTENLAELDAHGRVKRAYTFAGSERTGYKSRNRTAVYVKDHLGSTKMTLALYASTLQEALIQRAGDADPYGVSWREAYSASSDSEPHQYTGQEKEPDLDLYYYGARFYDPNIGRFLAVDPKREFNNAYSYVGNRPLFFVDANGEEAIAIMVNLEESLGTPLSIANFSAAYATSTAAIGAWGTKDYFPTFFKTPTDILRRLSWKGMMGETVVQGYLGGSIGVGLLWGNDFKGKYGIQGSVNLLYTAGSIDNFGGISIDLFNFDGTFIAKRIPALKFLNVTSVSVGITAQGASLLMNAKDLKEAYLILDEHLILGVGIGAGVNSKASVNISFQSLQSEVQIKILEDNGSLDKIKEFISGKLNIEASN